jgi:hypothetical protein
MALYGLNSEKALPVKNPIVSILLCLWPFPWLIWFSNRKYWTLRTYDPFAKPKQQPRNGRHQKDLPK